MQYEKTLMLYNSVYQNRNNFLQRTSFIACIGSAVSVCFFELGKYATRDSTHSADIRFPSKTLRSVAGRRARRCKIYYLSKHIEKIFESLLCCHVSLLYLSVITLKLCVTNTWLMMLQHLLRNLWRQTNFFRQRALRQDGPLVKMIWSWLVSTQQWKWMCLLH